MNEEEFHRRWSDRTARYPNTSAAQAESTVHIHVDPDYAETHAGQVGAITAASLIGRMYRNVAVDVPSLRLCDTLPWAGAGLDDIVMRTLEDAHRYGHYEQRTAHTEDHQVVIGPTGSGLVAHGAGWGAYCGMGPSPLGQSDEPNPFGAAFAVVMAAAQLQRSQEAWSTEPTLVDTYLWRADVPHLEAPHVVPSVELGEVWSTGVGSVGSCSLFFLGLTTRAFKAVLVDADPVEIENVTRSAVFSWKDALDEVPKVTAASGWLRDIGVVQVESHVAWLDEIPDRWRQRPAGTPDVLISAANERNVRSTIEGAYPPLQVYGTTGRNWQATLFRHIPVTEACSRCVPGEEKPVQETLCATGKPEPGVNDHEDDVALPFLSYAAGLMTAAEIIKLTLTGHPVTPNRVFFEPGGRGLFALALREKPGCICQGREASIHRAVVEGSRFAPLSGTPHPQP